MSNPPYRPGDQFGPNGEYVGSSVGELSTKRIPTDPETDSAVRELLRSNFTPEQIAAAFAPYAGRLFQWEYVDEKSSKVARFVDVLDYETLAHLDSYPGLCACLQPLWAITDEDAWAAGNLTCLKPLNEKYHWFERKEDGIWVGNDVWIGYDGYMAINIGGGMNEPASADSITTDFLRSRGYDLPSYHLGGLAIHEAEATEAPY